MGRLVDRLETHQLEASASIAWAVTAILVGTAGQFLRLGEPDWAAMTLLVVGVALVPPVIERDRSATLPGELLGLVALPILSRVVGAFPQATPFLAAAGLALVAAIVIEAYTSLAMTPRFVVVFTVITAMAFAGVWTVGIWIADSVVGTTFLGDKTELMWDLVTATAMGLGAGLVFEGYFAFTDRLERLRTGRSDDGGRGREGERERDRESIPSLDRIDRSTGTDRHRMAIRALQVVLGVVTAFALVQRQWPLVINSAVPLGLTYLPAVLRREYGYRLDIGLVLWVTVAATLHTVGALGPYELFDWYDSVTHTVSASLVAGIGYAIARAAELHTEDVTFQPSFRAVFVLVFVLAVGVAWELLEFATGGLATLTGGEAVLAQYGAADIAKDLLFDGIGGGLVALWSTDRFEGIARLCTESVRVLVRRE